MLEPLGQMASRHGLTVLCISHLNKSSSGDAAMRVIGSIAFVNHARAAHLVIREKESERRLMIPMKANLAKFGEGLAYRIEEHGLDEKISAPVVIWDGTVTTSADDAIAAVAGDQEAKSALDEAQQFLIDMLSSGPVAAREVQAEARERLISIATLRRAKKQVGVTLGRDGFGPGSTVVWSIGAQATPIESIGAHSQEVSTYEQDEHLCEDKSAKTATDDGLDLEIPAFLDRRRKEE